MTTIQKGNYIFEVDLEKTKEYYKTHSLCDCAYCRNYYAQAQSKFPELNDFLNKFGVNISKPDEISSVETDHEIDYLSVDYTVCGCVKSADKDGIDILNSPHLHITVINGFVSPNEQTGEYFTISVAQIKLPWVLNEPVPKATQ